MEWNFNQNWKIHTRNKHKRVGQSTLI
jgi:hypothetical protein